MSPLAASPRPHAARTLAAALAWAAVALLAFGCASFRSEMTGAYTPPSTGRPDAPLPAVNLFFWVRHLDQAHGLDAVPKLPDTAPENELDDPSEMRIFSPVLEDFEDLFDNAVTEIRNVDELVVFTETSQDPYLPERMEHAEKLRDEADFAVEMTFFKETWFVPQVVAGTVSLVTLTVIPVWFTERHTLTVEVSDRQGRTLGRYERSAELKDWVELFLVFVFPFHPRERKLEEIYVEMMQDVFRQIDAEGVLALAEGAAGG
jgi:hypothetical protein